VPPVAIRVQDKISTVFKYMVNSSPHNDWHLSVSFVVMGGYNLLLFPVFRYNTGSSYTSLLLENYAHVLFLLCFVPYFTYSDI